MGRERKGVPSLGHKTWFGFRVVLGMIHAPGAYRGGAFMDPPIQEM